MNTIAPVDTRVDTPPRLPALAAGAQVRAIVPADFDSAWRIANAVVKAGMAPKGLETPEKAMVAIMHGLEVGMAPMAALQSIAVVNGRPSIWGDGAIGLVRASGLLDGIRESIEGDGEDMKAVCTVRRRGEPDPIRNEFSAADARKAGLWGKSGPWQQYPKRMLQMRARAFTLRDAFADVLRGLHIAEEAQDVPDVSLTSGPPSPPPAPAIAPPAPPSEEVEDAVVDEPMRTDGFLDRLDAALAATTTVDDLEAEWEQSAAEAINGDLLPAEIKAKADELYTKHRIRIGAIAPAEGA